MPSIRVIFQLDTALVAESSPGTTPLGEEVPSNSIKETKKHQETQRDMAIGQVLPLISKLFWSSVLPTSTNEQVDNPDYIV